MPVQDDAREKEMIQLFNLTVPDDRSRGAIDAHLVIDGVSVDFELKSSTSGSVSTVRDFGPDHIAKWRKDLHWLFAFYDKTGTRLLKCVYASPAHMEPWIAEKESYISADLRLADSLPQRVTPDLITQMFGVKSVYTRADAQLIMKKQWAKADYEAAEDVPGGYSLERMLVILQSRARYVILRGSTLNNPHIEKKFFANFESIQTEHASTLRAQVRHYLENARDIEAATA